MINYKLKLEFLKNTQAKPGGCLNWLGTIKDGTPVIKYEDETITARELSYQLEHGKPPGSKLRVMCRNPLCVRASHLGLVKENKRPWFEKLSPFEPEDIPLIFQLMASGRTQQEIAAHYQTDSRYISTIICRKKWKHIPVDKELVKEAQAMAKITKHANKIHGDNHPLAKLSSEKVREVRRLSADGMSNHKIAKKFKVSATTIRDIIIGKNWVYVQ